MTESRPTSTKRRNSITCGCLLVMFLICVVVPVAGFVGWGFRATSQVNAQLARIKQAGLPTKSDELDAYYQISAGAEDATQLYMAANQDFSGSIFEADCRVLPLVGDSEIEIPPPGQPWAQQQAVADFLAKYEDGLRALHQAAEMGGAARFPLDFSQGFSMLLPNVQSMRTCSRMLSLEAHVKAHQGDAAGTAESLLALATVSRSLENQPIQVSQLVRIAMNGVATDLTGRMLAHVEFSDEDLLRLQQAFRRADLKAGIAHAIAGERVIGAEAFKSPAAALGPNSGLPQTRILRGSNEDLALYLDIQSDLYDAVRLPYPDTFTAVDAAFARMKDRLAAPLGRLRFVMTGMTMPAIEACVFAAARGDGSNRCADAAIAVERFRRREGKLPETLDALVPDFLPEVPLDPYDGQPIRYIIKQDGYLVYTCGRDRTDDGGVEDERLTDDVIRVDFGNHDAAPAAAAPAEPALKPAAPTAAAPATASPDEDPK